MATVEIISIGSEIVLGQIIDSNAHYIAKSLTEKGFQVVFKTTVGDDKGLMRSALKIAKNRADLVVTTGGLGPTENDVTREVVSGVCGVGLVPCENAEEYIRKWSQVWKKHTVGMLKKQILVPEGAQVIPNDNGTAAGFSFRHGGAEIVCLPGVPGEMRPMLNTYLWRCSLLQYEGGCAMVRNLHTFGVSERGIEDKIKHFSEKNKKIKMMTLVSNGIVTITARVAVTAREQAVELLDRTEQDLREELGDAVFGVDDAGLECEVARLLKKRNKTISVAESCTGGLVSHLLTNISGISAFFLEGVVAYSNRAKIGVLHVPEGLIVKCGAVSPQVAKAMAEGIRIKASADIGVGITGIAGPTGGTREKPVGLVCIAVAGDDGTEVKECRFGGARIDIKYFSANTALNMVRLKLLNNT